MPFVTLSCGHRVVANIHDCVDILNSLDEHKRYSLTSRELGLLMEKNRQRKQAVFRAARAKANQLRKHQ